MDSRREEVHCWTLLLIISLIPCTTEAYSSYVVGGNLGWTTPSNGNINYTAWAQNITLSLGDSLVFHYESTHKVVQTDLLKTFESCDSTSDDNSLQIWSSPDSTGATVELRKTGNTYFFCSAYDGQHCMMGQRFQIYVNQGAGLPLAPLMAPSSGDDDENGDNDLPGFDNVPPPPPPLPEDTSGSGSSFACVWTIILVFTTFFG